MVIEFSEIVIPVISSTVTVVAAFYVKGFLSNKNAYSELRKKLENIAGKNATIVYAGAGDIGVTAAAIGNNELLENRRTTKTIEINISPEKGIKFLNMLFILLEDFP